MARPNISEKVRVLHLVQNLPVVPGEQAGEEGPDSLVCSEQRVPGRCSAVLVDKHFLQGHNDVYVALRALHGAEG